MAHCTHTFEIPGGSFVSKKIDAGESFVVTDPEGDQQCLVLAFDEAGKSALASLGLETNDYIPEGDLNRDTVAALRAVVGGGERDGLRATSVFDLPSAASTSRAFTATTPLSCTFVAVGQDMEVDAHNPPTRLIVDIERQCDDNGTLPEPLAKEGVQDIRVKRRSAVSYPVKKGQYIQIIDVEGNQCTDFQAFIRADLEEGRERCIDATTTRSTTGAACPLPGVHNKFYSVDIDPMLEIVQDTVVRHDTFGLACNAKYYEEKGFPGHINCTDNFNAALSPYGVRPREGWMAANFFFNTGVDDHDQMIFDEPWSMPGDYVLMRALTDLVCVSSACPDDTDGANAWNPTDIHVRVYDDIPDVEPSTAYRVTPKDVPKMTKETGFHPKTSQLTRNFTEYNGYWLANSYTDYGARQEYWACRDRVVLIDLSPLRKFEVYGPDAEKLLQYTLPKDVRKLSVGQVVYTAICYANGCMMDDGTLFRMGDRNFRWICGCERTGLWLREVAEEKGLHVWVKNSTDQLHNLSVQGPESRRLLKEIVWTPPTQASMDELRWFRYSVARLGGAKGVPVVVSRTGYTGELGYEVWCHPKDAPAVWDKLWKAGEKHGVAPAGLEALDMLRIEAGLIFAGYEFCDQTDPFEAGIGFSVPLDKGGDDFVGKEALVERRENPHRKLVGLEIATNQPVGHGDGVYIGRQQIGEITSSTISPVLGKNIALCRVSSTHAEVGTELEVGKLDGFKKRIAATVVSFPFYDPEKKRVKS